MKIPALSVVVLAFAATAVGAQPGTEVDLDALLVRLDGTASAYAERSRSFSCQELIRWEKKDTSGRKKFGYVVVQGEDGVFDDYRTRLKQRKATIPSRVRPEKFGVPSYLRSAYLWVFIFKRDRWPLHRYEIVGEEELFGRSAVVLRFEPLPPYREGLNNWFGSAWIDPETAQVLKVDAHRPEDHEELSKIELHRAGEAASSWTYHVELISTEFEIEQREMRFPSRVELRQIGYDFTRGSDAWDVRERTLLSVYQTYSDYRFFDVRSTSETDKDGP